MSGWLAVLAAGVAATTLPLSATSSVSNGISPSRVITVTAHTGAGASCALTDSLSGVWRKAAASGAGRATWRWRPSVWASGAVTFSIHCARGKARASTETFQLLGALEQIHVIRHFALHLVYWAPRRDMPPAVRAAVSRLETDIKASLDAGATDNPFAVPRAYGDSLGSGDPRIASIDATDDMHPYPQPTQGWCAGVSSPCLGAPDIGTEVKRLARRHGWSGGNHSLVMVFTAPSLTVCSQRHARCAPETEPCGFHAIVDAGYAYGQITMSGARSHCGGHGSAPSYAVALVDHEQNEAIVDPWGGGVEIADKCDGDFKSVRINGHAYDLQAVQQHGRCTFAYRRR